MIYLILASLLWALSFSLIKNYLTGLDSNFVACLRLLISFIVFLPFLRPKFLNRKTFFQLMLIGAVEYGLMYMAYILSFKFLYAYEVATFTIFTPLYVIGIHDIRKKKLNKYNLLAALIAVIGATVAVSASVIVENRSISDVIYGFLLLQVANISFAFGQIEYRAVMKKKKIGNASVFAVLFLGATLLTLPFAALSTDWINLSISSEQSLVLLWLGVIPSGFGFYLWNKGARKTKSGYLAVFNNLKIPFGILVSVLFFSERPNISRLVISLGLIFGALLIAEQE